METPETQSCFTVDAMLYMMCINPVAGNEFDTVSAHFTEYAPDGTTKRFNIETVEMDPTTPLNLVTKDSALDLIYEYTKSDDSVEHAMLSYDMFATRTVDGKVYLYGWYDRSK